MFIESTKSMGKSNFECERNNFERNKRSFFGYTDIYNHTHMQMGVIGHIGRKIQEQLDGWITCKKPKFKYLSWSCFF